MIELSDKSYLGGHWVTPGGPVFSSFDAAKKEPLRAIHSCTLDEIEIAVRNAAQAQLEYRKRSGHEIAEFLRECAAQIEELGDQLISVAASETALPIQRLVGERERTCGQLRMFADLAEEGEWVQASIDTAIPGRSPVPKPDLRRQLRPLGVVAVFGASNFPFAFGILGGDSASALAAGNAIVVKGHPSHPSTSELLAHAIIRAIENSRMPMGLFSLLQGAENDLGTNLVSNDEVAAVGFTGSLSGGRALMNVAAARTSPIPVFAEMGSTNPVFILSDALSSRSEEIASDLASSVTLGTGQFCTSPGIVISSDSDDFGDSLKNALHRSQTGPMLNNAISESYELAISRRTDLSGVYDETASCDLRPGNSVKAVLHKTSADIFLKDPALLEEVFGPTILWVCCDDGSDMIACAEHIEGSLTASVICDREDRAQELIEVLERKAGRIVFNGYPTGVEVCPSMQHGGPYPASSSYSATSVGTDAITRFARFTCYQNMPDELLPDAVKNDNPLGIFRRVNGALTNGTL